VAERAQVAPAHAIYLGHQEVRRRRPLRWLFIGIAPLLAAKKQFAQLRFASDASRVHQAYLRTRGRRRTGSRGAS